MGCISPQFHCTFDENFTTVSDYTYQSLWREKAHLVSPQPKTNTLPDALPVSLPEPPQQTTDDSTATDNNKLFLQMKIYDAVAVLANHQHISQTMCPMSKLPLRQFIKP
jgi:hypothetical protein